MIDQRAVKLAHAVRMTKEVGARISEIFAGAVGHVMRNLDLFHLAAIDRMWAEIARNRRREIPPGLYSFMARVVLEPTAKGL